MELRELRTFQTVAKTTNFTQAALLLGYAQSSITAQIQALEQELGVPLFDRLGRGVVLTDAGQNLLVYAEKLLDLADEAQAAVVGTPDLEGTITLGAPETICAYRLPPLLRAFRQQFPKVRLIFKSWGWEDLQRGVKEGALDVAFMLAEPLQSKLLHVVMMFEEPLWLVAAPSYPLAGAECVLSSDLEGETLLLTEKNCYYRRVFENRLSAAGVHPATVMDFDSIEAIKQCTIAGLGIAPLLRVAVEKNVAEGQLVRLNWSESASVWTQMIWHRDKWLSPALKTFLQMSQDMLTQ